MIALDTNVLVHPREAPHRNAYSEALPHTPGGRASGIAFPGSAWERDKDQNLIGPNDDHS